MGASVPARAFADAGMSAAEGSYEVELSCGHHVTAVRVRGHQVKCPWCPGHEVVTVVAVDGRKVRPYTDRARAHHMFGF